MLLHNTTSINRGALVYSLLCEIPLTIYDGEKRLFNLDYSNGYLDYELDNSKFRTVYELVDSDILLWSPLQLRAMHKDFVTLFVELSHYFDILANSFFINYGDFMTFESLVVLDKRILTREGELLSTMYNGKLVHMTLILSLSKQMDLIV